MQTKQKFKPDPKLKLMDQVRQVLRYHHYALNTERRYCEWILRYIKFHGGKTHPTQMGKTEIEAFLSHMATHDHVSASTQRQALNAIIFLYRHVLDKPVEDQLDPVRAKKYRRPPVVMTQSEVQRVLANMQGTHLLMGYNRDVYVFMLFCWITYNLDDLIVAKGNIKLPILIIKKIRFDKLARAEFPFQGSR
ncbi:MAG: phage integrase N-terminal SAM-like domain-containing protein [Proteobacteria bacterium]|nr:phage integrase N-terminal SAM-like domain-containing protein [Pseudomonadota bacterium]